MSNSPGRENHSEVMAAKARSIVMKRGPNYRADTSSGVRKMGETVSKSAGKKDITNKINEVRVGGVEPKMLIKQEVQQRLPPPLRYNPNDGVNLSESPVRKGSRYRESENIPPIYSIAGRPDVGKGIKL